MAICSKCNAEVANGLAFCTQCGNEMKQTSDIEPAKKTGWEVADTSSDAGDANNETMDQSDFEQEASKWAQDNIEADKPSGKKNKVQKTKVKAIDNVHQNLSSVKTTKVYTKKGKNTVPDKFFGLVIFAFIALASIFMFVYGIDSFSSTSILQQITSYMPIFILACSALLLARTGSLDFTPVAIVVFTYFMLISGYNQEAYYLYVAYTFAIVLILGLLSGVFSSVFMIPNVFFSIPIFAVIFAYAAIVLGNGYHTAPAYTGILTQFYLPIALAIFTFLIMFIMIFTSRLGQPLFKRKGIMRSDRTYFILVHIVSYLLAALAGICLSINSTAEISILSTVMQSIDYIIAIFLIVCLCGASSFFDNKVMPQLMLVISFFIWLLIDMVLTNMFGQEGLTLYQISIKSILLVLALIADRVYTRNQLPEYYNTVCIISKEV